MVSQGGKTSATNAAGGQRLFWGDRASQLALTEFGRVVGLYVATLEKAGNARSKHLGNTHAHNGIAG
jgi:hypothetical protein